MTSKEFLDKLAYEYVGDDWQKLHWRFKIGNDFDLGIIRARHEGALGSLLLRFGDYSHPDEGYMYFNMKFSLVGLSSIDCYTMLDDMPGIKEIAARVKTGNPHYWDDPNVMCLVRLRVQSAILTAYRKKHLLAPDFKEDTEVEITFDLDGAQSWKVVN